MDNLTPSGLLVLDEGFDVSFPRHFRSSLNKMELSDLRFMASAQFSERTLIEALKPIKEKVWLVDLRRETHGFVNGIPISWYETENKSNIGRSTQVIMQHEALALANLEKNKAIVVNEIIKKSEGLITKSRTMTFEVNYIESEAQLAHRLHLGYLRLAVLDHHRPDDVDVDAFVAFVKNLPDDNWLYFHCRGGKGRSSTFVVLYDILKNGKKLSLEEISQRQVLLGSKNLLKISDESTTSWKKEAAIARSAFIEQFYEYLRSDEGYPKLTWSQWRRK